MFATPRSERTDDGPSKVDLVGVLLVVKVTSFLPETPTKYGTSAILHAELTVVEGPNAGRYPEWFAAGNLARQIGDSLAVGELAPGRIETGASATGRNWYGISWADDPADLAAAEAAVKKYAELPPF